MTRTVRAGLLAGVLALALALDAAALDPPLAVGARAPDLELSDQQGKPFRLSEALSKRDYIVLAFYVKAFTGG